MKKGICLFGVTLLLSSCGIYTNYHKADEVPEGLYGEEVVSTSEYNIASMSWRELFIDPTLQALIEEGLQNNADMQTARLRVEEAEAALLSAKLAYLPSFALAPQGTIAKMDGVTAKSYNLPLTASWQVDIFGGIRNGKKQAKAVYEQTKDYEQAVQSQLIAGIANTYYTLQMLDAQLAISETTEKSWGESVRSTRALMNAGLANEVAVAQMEAAHYGVKSSVLSLKEQINQVENAMSLLLAKAPQSIERGKKISFTAPQVLAVGIPVQMLDNRPDVRSAERALEAAFYGTNAARAAFYPNITLSGSAGWTNSAGGAILDAGEFLVSALGSLTQPLFAQGKLQAQYKIAKARQEEAELAFRKALLNAGAEVNEAMVACQTSREKAELYNKQVVSLETAYRSTSLLMEHGNTTYLEVLTAQQSYLNAQLQQVANQFAEIQSVISLYQALGGGQN